MGSDCQTVLKRQKARKANPLDRPREASPGLPPAHTRARESKQRHTRRVDRAPPIRCAPRSARARRRPPLSGDVRCHFVLSMRQRLPGRPGGSVARGPARAGARQAANGRPRAIARCLGSRSSPERGPARDRSRPRGSTRAIGPRRPPHPLAASSGAWTARGGGPVRARTRAAAAPRPPIADDRARRPTDPRGYRRAGTVGRRARAAVTRAPPLASHPQPRSETIAPSQPAIHHHPLLPSLTSPAHQNS